MSPSVLLDAYVDTLASCIRPSL